MRQILCFAFISVFIVNSVFAGELRGGLTVGNFSTQFQKAIKSLNLPITVSKGKCGKKVLATCQYQTSSKIAFIVAGAGKQRPATSVTLVFGKGSDGENFIFDLGAMVIAVDPKLSPNERGKIITNTVLVVLKKGSGTEKVVKNGITYTATLSDVVGLWFIAERK